MNRAPAKDPKVDRLVMAVRFAATFAEAEEVKRDLINLVGRDEAIRLIYVAD